jgi:hypothetical protein
MHRWSRATGGGLLLAKRERFFRGRELEIWIVGRWLQRSRSNGDVQSARRGLLEVLLCVVEDQAACLRGQIVRFVMA